MTPTVHGRALRVIREIERLRPHDWPESLLLVGVISMVASLLIVVAQLGAVTSAGAVVVLPADSLATPYRAAPHPRGPDDPSATAGTASTARPTSSATAFHPCPAPSAVRRPGVSARDPLVLTIPRIGVDAQVEQAGLDRHGHMQVPVDQCDVAWFKLGSVPGAAGDAVIDGHLDWTTGPSVFWNLHALHRGDLIGVLTNGGAWLRFTVTRVFLLAHATDQTGLFSTSGSPVLSLYTCAGTWEPWVETYSQRLVVDAVPVR